MNSQLILNVCLKVVGVFYSLKALNMLPSSVATLIIMWRNFHQASATDRLNLMFDFKLTVSVSILIPIILFAIAIILVIKSESLAKYLLPTEDTLETQPSEGSQFVLSICIKVFGFFSVLASVPYLSSFVSRLWVMEEKVRYYDATGKIQLGSEIISIVLYIGVGFILIFQSEKIAHKLSPHRALTKQPEQG